MLERTLKKVVTLTGTGIHSAAKTTLTCIPAQSGGIKFIRTDLNNTIINVSPENIKGSNRATLLGNKNALIKTPEHLLSALAGLNISHLTIEINQEEIPILDGSALEFITTFQNAGLKELKKTQQSIEIKQPIIVKDKDMFIHIEPSNKTTINFEICYQNHFINTQTFTLHLNTENYINEIAPARTYGFENEVKKLIEQGLAKGGSLNNALIIGEKDYINPYRFKDECVRHKILDLIGDLYILGKPILGTINAYKSGHSLNLKMAQAIANLYI